MNDTLALLLADGYKHVHAEQFPKGLTKLVSYLTPRKSRIPQQEMVFFGLQGFIQQYLIEYFNKNFFELSLDEVIKQYTHVLDSMLGKNNYGLRKVIELHQLGYLPLQICAVREGTKVPMGCPCIEITNTHADFAWVVQWVESLISSEIWKPCVHATVGDIYKQVVNHYYGLTVDDKVDKTKAISDFGFRGMSCLQEATKASAAWLLSFSGTATIPAIPYLEKYYNCDNSCEYFASNAISTEHSVMASNFAIDGDERTFVKRLLTEVYPHASFSMVSDTYDYWRLVDEILPSLKEEILNHDGKLLIRPDSGDIIEISVKTVEHLWNIFGGTVNSKGYKVLDKHIGCVYGDGVTPNRAKKIYQQLMDKGFASNNIVFGAGSFSFNAFELEKEDGSVDITCCTRDTFSIAIKSTCGVVNCKEIEIFKDPKTDRDSGGGNFKKSQRGCCNVWRDETSGKICFKDGLPISIVDDRFNSFYYIDESESLFYIYFKDGEMYSDQSLYNIREYLSDKSIVI